MTSYKTAPKFSKQPEKEQKQQPGGSQSVLNSKNNKDPSYHWCSVPQCLSDSLSTPMKLLICVPREEKMRKQWLNLAKREDEGTSECFQIYFCEDHFDLPNDMANYLQYTISGHAENFIMKPDCLPSKFHCQDERVLCDKNNSNLENQNNCPIIIMDDDDSSNDVEAVEHVEQDTNFLDSDEERPIMLLFGRLIGNDNKQNTVLTNAQILQILQIEFQIDIKELHELELDIILTVTKKFLKDWPQWDDFDRIVNGLKTIKAYESIKKILDKKYKHLKEYLRVMLEETQRHTETVMSELLPEEKEDDDVVMEISCTRSQLNQLIFRRPHPDMHNTIFNITNPSPSRIVLNTFNIETILNWWDIKININLYVLSYRRQTAHIAKHMLVNKVRTRNANIEKELPQDLQMKAGLKTSKCEKTKITELLDRILLQYINNIEVYYLIETIFNLLKDDLKDAPKEISVPATYRKFSSKYKYKRYLNADSNAFSKMSDQAKYDLQLEETISPRHEFFIGKVDTLNSLLPPFSDWFNIECVVCNEKFSGGKLMDSFKVHFNDYHMNEPDWMCTNCNKTFTMAHLAERKWCHSCNSGESSNL